MAGLPSALRRLGLWLSEKVTSEPGMSQTTVRSDVAPVWLISELVGWPVQITGANVRYPLCASGKRTGSKPPKDAHKAHLRLPTHSSHSPEHDDVWSRPKRKVRLQEKWSDSGHPTASQTCTLAGKAIIAVPAHQGQVVTRWLWLCR
jgi:hypothetical protein